MLKKINILYILFIPLAYLLWSMNMKLSQTSAFFYGFAENKETEISHYNPISVQEIFVTPGQQVTKGQLIMEVKQNEHDLKVDEATNDMQRIDLIAIQEKAELKSKINQLKAKRTKLVAEKEVERRQLQAAIKTKEDLLKGLSITENISPGEIKSEESIKLAAIDEQIKIELAPIDAEIVQLETDLVNLKNPDLLRKSVLQREIDYYKEEEGKLSILAPSDGLIGNVLCKKGENVDAFSTLVNFYERYPTIVKGFVHESLILEVQVNDSLSVSSTMHPDHKVDGHVIGLGTRIVEIPERLRKIPDFKTYGREILIRIPSKNPFLQKEKVMLNTFSGEPHSSLGDLFSPFTRSPSKQEKKISKKITDY